MAPERGPVLPLAPGSAKGQPRLLRSVPGAVQSVIDITFPVYLKPGHPDVVAVSVMNTMLGGFFEAATRTSRRQGLHLAPQLHRPR